MKILRATFRDHAHLTSGGAAILGIVIGRQDLHFLCGIEIGGTDTERIVRPRTDSNSTIIGNHVLYTARTIDVKSTGA